MVMGEEKGRRRRPPPISRRMKKLSEDVFKKVIKMIREDPNLSDFHKEQLLKALINPDPKWNEDEFLEQFPADIRIFLIKHLPYPIPKHLKKLEDYK